MITTASGQWPLGCPEVDGGQGKGYSVGQGMDPAELLGMAEDSKGAVTDQT